MCFCFLFNIRVDSHYSLRSAHALSQRHQTVFTNCVWFCSSLTSYNRLKFTIFTTSRLFREKKYKKDQIKNEDERKSTQNCLICKFHTSQNVGQRDVARFRSIWRRNVPARGVNAGASMANLSFIHVQSMKAWNNLDVNHIWRRNEKEKKSRVRKAFLLR